MNLVANIRRVFSEREYPGDTNIVKKGDHEGDGELFVGATWGQLDYREMERRTFVLHCFTTAGFCYFLPAYLIASVELPLSGMADAVLFRMRPPKNDTGRNSFVEWWSLLSVKQKQVIVEVVKFHVAKGAIVRPGAIEALENACKKRPTAESVSQCSTRTRGSRGQVSLIRPRSFRGFRLLVY